MPKFELNSAYTPVADQPSARDQLAQGIDGGDRFQTLLGVTGSGKTATMAFAIEKVQRPALVIAHNKTLFARRDVVIVASVSCIYGLGSPEKYNQQMVLLKKGEMVDRDHVLRRLVEIQYSRNDTALGRGSFRVRGDRLEIFPSYAESAFAAEFFGDEIESIQHFDPLTGEVYDQLEHIGIWPATHYATDRPTIERSVGEIRDELEARCKELEAEGKLLESHRLRQRTQFDMEMLRELGFCNGIENYSRILDGRAP